MPATTITGPAHEFMRHLRTIDLQDRSNAVRRYSALAPAWLLMSIYDAEIARRIRECDPARPLSNKWRP